MTEKTWRAFEFILRNYTRSNEYKLKICFEKIKPFESIRLSGYSGHGIRILSCGTISVSSGLPRWEDKWLEIEGLNKKEQEELKEYIFKDNFPYKDTCIII